MEENKEKYQNEKEVLRDGQMVVTINYKPKTAYMITILVSVALCLSFNWILVAFGVFVLALSCFVLFYVKDHKVMDIYDYYVLIYNLDNDMVRRINYEEVTEWTCKHGETGADAIMLKLVDEEVIYKDTFHTGKAYRAFNKIMPEKESQARKDAESAKTKLKFSNPFKKRSK